MAAPTVFVYSSGVTDAGGAWTFTSFSPNAIGNIFILHIFQDGATSGAVTLDSATNIENLAGTDNAWTSIGSFAVGSPTVGYQHLWIGRSITAGSGAPTATGSNSTSEDLYARFFEIQDVSTGTTLATVIENATAGSTTTTSGTDGTVQDAGVTTLGPDRLALNFIAISDDNAQSDFTGMTGGTWAEAAAEYAEANGTDGSIGIQTATMASPGTINSGTFTNADATDGWGVVGFALIGTTKTSLLRPHRYHLIRR